MGKEDRVYKKIVHVLLVHGYLMFFVAIILGAIVDLFSGVKFSQDIVYQQIGVVMIMLGTVLVYFAQSSSGRAGKIKKEEANVEGFKYGPYKYFHHPTYLGLFIMTLGLGLTLNSPASIILVFVAHLLIKFVFIKKEERILEEKYGEIFTSYKKKGKNKK